MKKTVLLPIFFILFGCISIPMRTPIGPYRENVLIQGNKTKVLVMNVSGIIIDRKQQNLFGSQTEMNLTSRLREQFDKAAEDPRIAAVIIKIDSPGGSVTTSDILHYEIKRFKRNTGKYVIAQLESTAASGGYYIATAADYIIAHPTTVTGSIGVIITMVNIEGLLDKIGVEDQTMASGKSKAMGSIMKKMTPHEQKLFQEIIDSMYERFLSVVLEGRKELTREKLLPVADGRVLVADKALKAGLIDSIGYWDDTLAIVKKKINDDNPTVITYSRPGQYTPNIYSTTSVENRGSINILSVNSDLFYSKYGISFMYLWKP